MSSPASRPYRNAMEPLVVQEVRRQMSQLAPGAIRNVNPADVVAYALNFLPALYATTKDGWTWQQTRAKRDLKGQISEAVSQGLIVVHQSPQRSEARLYSAEDSLFDAQKSLKEVALLLGQPKLNWTSLVPMLKQALLQASQETDSAAGQKAAPLEASRSA